LLKVIADGIEPRVHTRSVGRSPLYRFAYRAK